LWQDWTSGAPKAASLLTIGFKRQAYDHHPAPRDVVPRVLFLESSVSPIMDMKEEWLVALRAWASGNNCIRGMWLFGSRARGVARPDSDIDIALDLMPPSGKTNWALAAYVESFKVWKADLQAAVDWDVSLIAIGPGFDLDDVVRMTGVCIWARDEIDNSAKIPRAPRRRVADADGIRER